MHSLRGRLLIAASVVLAAFLGLTGLTLDRAFRDSALAAVQDRLQAQVYMLLGAVEVDGLNRLTLPQALPEVRFSLPDSGLYADVMDSQGNIVWHSSSLLGLALHPAYRCWLMRHQRAGQPRVFLTHPLQWWPAAWPAAVSSPRSTPHEPADR